VAYITWSANHVFLPGHRIMVQVQWSWFALYDRNSQTFVPSILAKPGIIVQRRKASIAVGNGWKLGGRASAAASTTTRAQRREWQMERAKGRPSGECVASRRLSLLPEDFAPGPQFRCLFSDSRENSQDTVTRRSSNRECAGTTRPVLPR
jgi:hypothetical protein